MISHEAAVLVPSQALIPLLLDLSTSKMHFLEAMTLVHLENEAFGFTGVLAFSIGTCPH